MSRELSNRSCSNVKKIKTAIGGTSSRVIDFEKQKHPRAKKYGCK